MEAVLASLAKMNEKMDEQQKLQQEIITRQREAETRQRESETRLRELEEAPGGAAGGRTGHSAGTEEGPTNSNQEFTGAAELAPLLRV